MNSIKLNYIKKKVLIKSGAFSEIDSFRYFDDRTAFQIALGNKDIFTMEQIDDYDPDVSPVIFCI